MTADLFPLLTPGRQADGVAWFVPVRPLRKDRLQPGTQLHRHPEYKQRRALFLSYMWGYSGKIDKPALIEIEMRFYFRGQQIVDGDNGEGFCWDCLGGIRKGGRLVEPGIAFDDDSQIRRWSGEIIDGAGFDGIWFRVTRLE